MHAVADYILIGGKIIDQDRLLIEKEKENSSKAKIIMATLNQEGTDIGEERLEKFKNIRVINHAHFN